MNRADYIQKINDISEKIRPRILNTIEPATSNHKGSKGTARTEEFRRPLCTRYLRQSKTNKWE